MDELFPPEEEDFFMDLCRDQEDGPPVPFVGLRNLGNSCFFNSVLQILFYCPWFQNYMEKYKEQVEKMVPNEDDIIESSLDSGRKILESDEKKCKLFNELQNLFLTMREKQMSIAEKSLQGEKHVASAAEPRSLLKVLREVFPDFEPFTQQDAQECLRCMLDALHDAVSLSSGKQQSSCSEEATSSTFKVFGGSKGSEAVITKISGHYQSENRDPLTARGESKTTLFRKRGLKIFKKPLKRAFHHNASEKQSIESTKKSKILNPLTENQDHNNVDAKKWSLSHKLNKKRETATFLNHKTGNGLPKAVKGLCIPSSLPTSDTSPNRSDDHDEYSDLDAPKNTIKLPKLTDKFLVKRKNSFPAEENGNSFIQGLFQGELINEIRCMECENCAKRVEEFMDISLAVRQDTVDQTNNQGKCLYALNNTGDTDIQLRCTVAWGLSAFTSNEILEGDNKYNCENCHRYTEGERRLLLHKLPPVLTLHLKRFSSGGSGLKGGLSFGLNVSKINTCFDIPLELTLSQWCSDSCKNDAKYKLFGVIVHSGSTVCSGHYLAYVRFQDSLVPMEEGAAATKISEYDGQWLEADDETVKVVSDDKLKEIISPSSAEGTTRTPYLLFYSRDN